MLITDRDLLALDPTAFLTTGAGGVATSLYSSSDAGVSGSTLTSAAADFATRGITVGHVAVVNAAAVGGLIAQRTLHAAFAQAASRDPSSASLASRALMWLGSVTRAEASLVALIDLDGDGWPEMRRHLRAPRWVRA